MYMSKTQKRNGLKEVFLQEEYRAEFVIAIVRIIVYFVFATWNAVQAAIMGMPVLQEAMPLIIAFLFSWILFFDIWFVGKSRLYKKFFSHYNKYVIILVDVVIISILLFSIKYSINSNGIFLQSSLNHVVFFPLFYGIVSLLYMIIDIFRFNVQSSYYAGALFVVSYGVVSYLYGEELYSNSIFPSVTSIVAVSLILAMFLCAFLSKRISKVIVKSKKQEQLERFLPQAVAQDFLNSETPLEETGRRQQAAILFADIRNFTAMSETQPPEEVVNFLNTYLNDMIEVVFYYNGTLDKILGDGIMAIFGAPIPTNEFSRHAVKASVDMLTKLKDFNNVRSMRGEEPVHIGIGIHTGDVLIGRVGTEKRMDFTAIGDTVNTASRLETLTKHYNVPLIISEQTKNHAKTDYPFQDLGFTEIRGRREKLRIYGYGQNEV